MSVHHNTRRDFKGIPHNHMGCFSAHSRELSQLIKIFGYFPLMMFLQALTGFFQIAGFISKKSCRLNGRFQVLNRSLSVIFSCFIFAKKIFCDNIHSFICTLSAQLGSNKKLQRVFKNGGRKKLKDNVFLTRIEFEPSRCFFFLKRFWYHFSSS